MNHEEFIRRAIFLAQRNAVTGRGGPFGAVIVRGDSIVAEGANQVLSNNDPTAHAEVVAIREACRALGRFRLNDCRIYSSCEPCPMCLSAIYWARLESLFYAASREDAAAAGFDDSLIYQQIQLADERRSLPARRILAEEGLPPFQEWQAFQGKIPY